MAVMIKKKPVAAKIEALTSESKTRLMTIAKRV